MHIIPFCSHLNSLVPQINKVAKEHLIDNLRSRADGETVVDMAKEFGRATLEVISVVSACVCMHGGLSCTLLANLICKVRGKNAL